MEKRPTRAAEATRSLLRRLCRRRKTRGQEGAPKRRPEPARRAPSRHLLRRLGSRAGEAACTLGRGLISTRFALTLCIALIALGLVSLGVGVCGRMEQAARTALDVAKLNVAAVEAQELARALSGQRVSSISASSDGHPVLSRGAGASDSHDESGDDGRADSGNNTGTAGSGGSDDAGAPPPLPARSVETILAEDAGMDLISARLEQQDAQATAPSHRDESAENGESGDEIDELIRSGVAAMIGGDMRRCILDLQAAYEINPNHPALLYYYGMAYDKLLNPDKAREYYTRVFRMRERAGRYFERASRRLTYGMARPSDMRGKLSFGPCRTQHTYDPATGESVHLLLPVLLAAGEEVLPEDIKIEIQMFDLINGRKIDFNRLADPQPAWEHDIQTFADGEENLIVTYSIPPLSTEQRDIYGDVRYYGFTAKLLYKGEPLDCISTPSALILHEQMLNNRRNILPGGLLPDDGLNYEEALPVSDFLDEQGNLPGAVENIPTELPENPS